MEPRSYSTSQQKGITPFVPEEVPSIPEVKDLKAQLANAMRLLSQYSEHILPDENKQYFYVMTERRLQKVYVWDISWVEADRNYITIYTENNSFTAHMPISRIEEQLPKSLFSRIHKSYIVAKRKVDFVEKDQVGLKREQQTTLLPLGSQFKKPFIQSLSQNILSNRLASHSN